MFAFWYILSIVYIEDICLGLKPLIYSLENKLSNETGVALNFCL